MFIAMLRVEMVLDVIWSRVLMLASWPKTKSPPTWGHLKGSARAVPRDREAIASTPNDTRFIQQTPRRTDAPSQRRLMLLAAEGGGACRGRQAISLFERTIALRTPRGRRVRGRCLVAGAQPNDRFSVNQRLAFTHCIGDCRGKHDRCFGHQR